MARLRLPPRRRLNVADLDEAVAVAELFCLAGLSRSRSEARRLIEQGGAYVNGEPVSDANEMVGRRCAVAQRRAAAARAKSATSASWRGDGERSQVSNYGAPLGRAVAVRQG